MTREELFRKNQQLSTEFELYLLDHPEIEEICQKYADFLELLFLCFITIITRLISMPDMEITKSP